MHRDPGPCNVDDDDFEVEQDTAELGLRCPRCCLPSLRRMIHERIEVDICVRCHGVWLDRGELDAVVNLAVLSDRYVRDLYDDDDQELVASRRQP